MKKNNTQTIEWHIKDPNPEGSRICLFLHGLGTDSSSWVYQLNKLSDLGYRPIAPDLPGFGRSHFEGNKWDLKLVTNGLSGLIEEYGFGKIDLIGLSLGGVMALKYCIDYPEKVDKLILVNTFACLRPKRIKEWYYLIRRFIIANMKGVEAQAEIVARNLFPRMDQEPLRRMVIEGINGTDPLVYRAAMREIARFDVRKQLKNIKNPVLVVSGADDKTVGLQVQYELSEGLPNSRHIIIPEAGHAVTIDQFDKFNSAIIEFLEG